MTTAITKAQAQAKLDALMAAVASETLTVRFGERSVTYRTVAELQAQINYWSRMVTELSRITIGAPRHGFSAADFRSRA